MRGLLSIGLLAGLFTAGCAWIPGKSPSTAPQSGAATPPGAITPAPAAAAPPSPATAPAPATPSTPGAVAPSSSNVPAPAATQNRGPSPAGAAPAGPATKKATAATTSVKTAGPTNSSGNPKAVAAAGAPASRAPPAAPAQTSAPATQTLNLADLEQRLRDTKAIGVFTKLSLKNQVDDLLDEFRALYKGPTRRPNATLRQHYDLLLLKVLTLLQDSDPPLAAAISSSREAIWGILADPDKFAKI